MSVFVDLSLNLFIYLSVCVGDTVRLLAAYLFLNPSVYLLFYLSVSYECSVCIYFNLSLCLCVTSRSISLSVLNSPSRVFIYLKLRQYISPLLLSVYRMGVSVSLPQPSFIYLSKHRYVSIKPQSIGWPRLVYNVFLGVYLSLNPLLSIDLGMVGDAFPQYQSISEPLYLPVYLPVNFDRLCCQSPSLPEPLCLST